MNQKKKTDEKNRIAFQKENRRAACEKNTLPHKINEEAIKKASADLRRYKAGKASLERRIVENEQWYKLRHWDCMEGRKNDIRPTSAWLFNCIANKHAALMDNYPTPTVLPREESDKETAEMLSSIIPVILEQNDFESVYDSVTHYKLKTGTGVYGIFWDNGKMNGLGDIAIRKIDLINLFWEPGITDIQQSKQIFHINLIDRDTLIEQYPFLEEKQLKPGHEITSYVYDDTIDTTEKVMVVDWYYKKNQKGKTVLHYCKFVNDTVLFATENEDRFRDGGWYDHGEYPFVLDVLFPVEGSPAGFGYIDVGKDAQSYIDRGNAAIMQNMLANARPRHFIRTDGAVNEEEYADITNDFVHVDGNLGTDSILPIQGKPLSDIYLTVINNKIDELKETTGNRDIATGGTAGGVTAASAIAAMQEAGNKLTRDHNRAAYRAFRKIICMTIELIRQFYDLPRCFRITGKGGDNRFVRFGNNELLPRDQGEVLGSPLGYRLPVFDIQIGAEKASPYTRMGQNEMALQFYHNGFFSPEKADEALMCLDMMDFDRKAAVRRGIEKQAEAFKEIQREMALSAKETEEGGMP